MNVNENKPVFGRGRGRGRFLKVVPLQRTLMGPPKRPVPKRKEHYSSAYTTSSSSRIDWKTHQNSAQNGSSVLHNGTSSRSHSSTEPESRVIIALSEGRGEAIWEVGLAAINIGRPSLILCQISDSQSYVNTLTKINILNPSEILIPLTFVESFSSNRLIEKVKEQFSDIKITGVPRSTFNKSVGIQYVKNLCVPSMNSILLILQHRYYALAAAAALLTYTESTLYIVYANESIKIEYQESEGSTIIDVATADRLELVASARPTQKKRYSCLLDVLNHCLTKIGALTLRASILQPPCSVPDIEARLECVTELKEHSEMLTAIQVILQKLSNIDQLLTLATVLPDQAQSCSERQLNYILILNSLLEQITPLRDIFENSKQPFFIELRETLGNPSFAEIKSIVRTLIHTDAHPAKGKLGIIQRCFAIKSGINSLLDLVRKSYSERVDDMREYVKNLGEKYNLGLSLNNNQKKGYHIVMNLNAHQKKSFKKNDLPAEFIQVERLSNTVTMNTQDLIDLSNRVEDINREILKMCNIMIYKVLVQIRKHIGIFYKLCEDIAKLDMLQSLAVASAAIQYVRPTFADYLEVTHARHPLLDFLCSVEPSANSMYASEEYNMNIITGPNGAGKSIFIRQVVLIQVMAQVGCYVPAQSATLRVADRILARVYLEDNLACGASAFVLEMKEIAYFLTVLTKNTLIIVDELCRSTSVEEGTALAMAVCEKLMSTPAFVFFTTHFKFLAKLRDLHFNIKTWQLETLTETIDDQIILRFTYSVIPGVTSLEHYGFFLAKGSWPEKITKYAEEILRKLSASQKKSSPYVVQANPAARLKYDLEAEFKALKAKKQLTQAIINEKLIKYERNLENLGHRIEVSLFSDHTENYNQSFSFQDNNHETYNINNKLPCYDTNVFETFNNSDVNLFNQVVNDDRNLHYSERDYPDEDINSQNISFIMAQQNQAPIPPAQPLFNTSNANKSQFFGAPIENIHQTSNNAADTSFSNYEDANSSLLQQSYDIPNNNRNISFTVPGDTRNIPEGFPLFTAEKCPKTFTSYSSNNFNFEQNNSGQHYPTDNVEINNSQNSYPNIFEPEIILESAEEAETNYCVQQESKELTIVHSEKSLLIQQNTIQIHTNSVVCPENIFPHSSFNEPDTTLSVEDSFVSQQTPISAKDLYHQNNSVYEEAHAEIHDYDESRNDYDLHLEHDVESNNQNQDSFMSINEIQFSLPLQQNIDRTSTPILHAYSQPAVSFYKQINPDYRSPTDKANIGQTYPVTVDKPLNSNSRSSDSIKWNMKIGQAHPKIGKDSTPLICNSTNSDSVHIGQTREITTNKGSDGSIKLKSNSTNSDSIKWNTKQQFKTPLSENKCDTKINTSKNKSLPNITDADVTAALNELQSCSEYFSEDWDSVAEEVNSQLSKSNLAQVNENVRSNVTHTKIITPDKPKTLEYVVPLPALPAQDDKNSGVKKKINIIHQVCLKPKIIYTELKPQYQYEEITLQQYDRNANTLHHKNNSEEIRKSYAPQCDKTNSFMQPTRQQDIGLVEFKKKVISHDAALQEQSNKNSLFYTIREYNHPQIQSQMAPISKETSPLSYRSQTPQVQLCQRFNQLQASISPIQESIPRPYDKGTAECTFNKDEGYLPYTNRSVAHSSFDKGIYQQHNTEASHSKLASDYYLQNSAESFHQAQHGQRIAEALSSVEENRAQNNTSILQGHASIPQMGHNAHNLGLQCDDLNSDDSHKLLIDETTVPQLQSEKKILQPSKLFLQQRCQESNQLSCSNTEQQLGHDKNLHPIGAFFSPSRKVQLPSSSGTLLACRKEIRKPDSKKYNEEKGPKNIYQNTDLKSRFCDSTSPQVQIVSSQHNIECCNPQYGEQNLSFQREINYDDIESHSNKLIEIDENVSLSQFDEAFQQPIDEVRLQLDKETSQDSKKSSQIQCKVISGPCSVPYNTHTSHAKMYFQQSLGNETFNPLPRNEVTSNSHSDNKRHHVEELNLSAKLESQYLHPNLEKYQQYHDTKIDQDKISHPELSGNTIEPHQCLKELENVKVHHQKTSKELSRPLHTRLQNQLNFSTDKDKKDLELSNIIQSGNNIQSESAKIFPVKHLNENFCPSFKQQVLDSSITSPHGVNPKHALTLDTSLEALGDIHLELFSDESIFDELQDQWKVHSDISHTATEQNVVNLNSAQQPKSPIENIDDNLQQNKYVTTDEYETALSETSVFETPSSSEYFMLKQNDTKGLKRNTTDDKISEQKPKRKRLGYISKTRNISELAVSTSLDHHPTESQSSFEKENSPDIFESQSDTLKNKTDEKDSSITSTSSSKKLKWKPPFKATANSTDSSNDQNTKKKKKPVKPKVVLPKFKPPKKLTKREIELDYYEQNKKMLESESSSQYVQQIINRPSVKQLQHATHIASLHKTDTGIVVVPAKQRKIKNTKQRKFVTPLKEKPQSVFDVSLFSDKNSDKFEQFMNPDISEKKTYVRQEMTAFQTISSGVVKKNVDTVSNKNSQETSFSDIGRNIRNFKNDLLQKLQEPKADIKNPSQISQDGNTSNNEGYYTQNKQCIDNIVDKYLNFDNISATKTLPSTSQKSVGSSIFSQATALLEDD